MIYTINECSIDTDTYEVRRGGRRVHVEKQVFDLLVLLLRHRDRVVTKDEIIAEVWNGRIVSEAALSSRIKSVRQVIGDDGASQALLRTIRGRGFRLVCLDDSDANDCGPASRVATPSDAEIRAIAADPAVDVSEPPPSWRAIPARRGLVLSLAVLAAIGLVAGSWWWTRPAPASPPSPIVTAALGMPAGPAIAVLRFANHSNDRALDFFGSALSEEIVTNLTRFSELRVAAHATTREFVGSDIDAREIARRLGVEYLVLGSLRQAAERLRVSTQLVQAQDGRFLWGETYERALSPAEIFSIQESIAGNVAAAIASISGGVIAREALTQARGKPPRELSAYECTTRANELMLTGFSAAAHLAIRDCLEATLEREPDYATAWAMLAWVHTLEFSEGHNRRPESDPLQRALAAGRRAIELAPASSLARFGMTRAAFLARDLELFRAEAAHALGLNPHDPLLLGNIGNWLAFSGQWEQGVALVRKAIALSPGFYPRWWHAAIAKDLFRNGAYEAALAEFKRMNLPNWWWNQVELAYTYGQLGDTANARKAYERLLELYPRFDLEKAANEHRKFSFEPSYIERVLEGLRRAGVPERWTETAGG
jgi:TolB-like protein/DNA-binding winged helix-turn-helix (wHTH) protein